MREIESESGRDKECMQHSYKSNPEGRQITYVSSETF